MSRFRRIAFISAFFLLLGQGAFAADRTLLGVTGSGQETSIAYVIDPDSGDAVELGQLTYSGNDLAMIASLASNPIDGYIYMVNNTYWSTDDEGKALYRISPTDLLAGITEVEMVADLSGLELGSTPDAAFRADGSFYVWSESGDDPILVDTNTGDITRINSGINSWATGIEFDSDGKLWVKTGNELHYIDINEAGDGSNGESRGYAVLNVTDGAGNMLSLGEDGYYWSGYRTLWGVDDPADTVIYKFLPTSGDITVQEVATVEGIKLSVIEWISGSASGKNKDRAFWSAVESCRLNMAAALSAGSDVSVAAYQSCFFTGVNASNVAAVNAALKALVAKAVASATPLSHAELMQSASMMADRLDLAQRLSTGKLVYAAEFKNLGLDMSTSTLDRLKSLPSAEVDTWEEIEVAASKG